ncbi:hypothetical protein CsSME_00036504 [Camellia sinensis var. sinensis]
MEEVGAQISPSIFIHQTLPAQFCEGQPNPMAKKRNLSFQVQQQLASGFQIPGNIWKPKDWNWDCVRFAAKPLESDVLHLGTSQLVQSEQHKIGRESSGISTLLEKNPVDQDNEILQLQLGGSLNSLQECVSRPNKRVRSGSPGGGGGGNGSYPVCQVDNCREDLSKAKDYHRRHKVCEIHSKSSTALVGKQIQRFHHLSEFDEGKRSCGQKTQTEDVSSRMLLPGSHDNAGNGDLDIVNLLTVLARAQGNEEVNSPNCSSVPNKDQLIQILSKMNSLPLPVDFETKLPVSESLTSTVPEQSFSDYQNKLNRNMSSASTKDLLAVLSATLAASTPDALAILSQRSSQGVEADKTKLACLEQALSLNMQRGTAFEFPSVGGESSNTRYQYPVEDSDCQVQEIRANLPLQLFSSSPEGDSLPKLTSARKYFSSGSSNPMEETSPSSSPSVVQKLWKGSQPFKKLRKMLKLVQLMVVLHLLSFLEGRTEVLIVVHFKPCHTKQGTRPHLGLIIHLLV